MTRDTEQMMTKIVRIEEKIEVILNRIAEHIQECHDHWKKQERHSESIITIETILQQADWREISNLNNRINNLEKAHDSIWKIFSPVISSLLGGGIVWAATKLIH